MKAIVMAAAGGPEVLKLQEMPSPSLPSPQHILVKLAAAGVNPVDTKIRQKPVYFPKKFPLILGCDGAGTVVKTGDEVSRFKVGDTVYFCNGGLGDEPGCYAEYTTLHQDYAAAPPSNIDLQESAALPLVLLTVWEALIDKAQLNKDQTILIHGAAGGVGHIAVQLAKHLGAKVAVTVNTDRQAALAQGLEADKIIRYKREDFVQQTLEWTHGKGVDVVFDTAGGDTFLRSMQATRIGGCLVSVLATAINIDAVQLARQRNLSLCFELMLTPQLLKAHYLRVKQREILEWSASLIESGELSVLVSHQLPLDYAAQAHQLLAEGSMLGKIILTMDI